MFVRSRLRYVAAAGAAALSLAACGGGTDEVDGPAAAPAEEQTSAFKEALAAAQEEGELNLNWGFSARDTRELVSAFSSAYPGIQVTITPNPNQPANLATLLQETQAGRPTSTDAFIGVPEMWAALGPGGADAMEAVDWTALSPRAESLATSDNVGLSLFDQIAGFTYNTSLIKDGEVPKTAADILELQQPVASTSYAAQFNALGTQDAMGTEGVNSYLSDFKPAGFIGCGELSRLASGEFAALWISCGKNIGDIFAAQGAPLETAVIQDAAVTFPWYMGVPKNSEHPNAAKVWITWLNSEEGQRLLFEQEFADNRRLENSKTAEQIAEFESDGVEFIEADYEFVLANPDLFSRKYAGGLIALLTKKQ